MSLNLRADLTGLNRMLDQLGTDLQSAARPAAQAAADVFYRAIKANVGAIGKVSGNLERSLYQAYSKDHSAPGRAVYHISWNARKAPHGHLVEFGHIQRYRVYLNKHGEWKTLIRPAMVGTKKPARNAPQAVKDAYYVPLSAPRQVAARPFIRPALARAAEASAAAEGVLLTKLGIL